MLQGQVQVIVLASLASIFLPCSVHVATAQRSDPGGCRKRCAAEQIFYNLINKNWESKYKACIDRCVVTARPLPNGAVRPSTESITSATSSTTTTTSTTMPTTTSTTTPTTSTTVPTTSTTTPTTSTAVPTTRTTTTTSTTVPTTTSTTTLTTSTTVPTTTRTSTTTSTMVPTTTRTTTPTTYTTVPTTTSTTKPTTSTTVPTTTSTTTPTTSTTVPTTTRTLTTTSTMVPTTTRTTTPTTYTTVPTTTITTTPTTSTAVSTTTRTTTTTSKTVPTTTKPTTITSTTVPTTTLTTTTTKPTTTTTTSITSSTTESTSTTTPMRTTKLPYQDCGIQRSGLHQHRLRIVGGFTADRCEYPWMALVSVINNVCGGAILDKRHILTAAHCVKNRITNRLIQPQFMTVRIGSSTIPLATLYSVVSVAAHPFHDPVNKVYDVAVLTIAEDLIFSECVSPICLPEEHSDPRDADVCTVAGWGVTDLSAPNSTPHLREVDVPIVDQQLCQKRYGENKVNELTFCAGDYYNGGIDSCQGDSGAPLMCRVQGRYVVHGIVSNGFSCALATYPGIYTRIAHRNILQFIQTTIGTS